MFPALLRFRTLLRYLIYVKINDKAINTMLCMEGLYYAVGTIAFSLILGVLISLFVIKNLMGGLWFVTYSFVILPLVFCWPIIIIISALIPMIALKGSMRESVVERLRVE